ncbi:phosphatidylserine decarboxylase family protein [Cytophaga aurantiaca]|uniref:phosphatidylserine decarboxylase family protein n=1 Tax=Cytophaga aurantiaca TaxID=29530 RepID=UPI00036FA198|nr:phosphatidylserine decarboxylase family protein [Cytophaga aurantiaca]
MTIHKEGYRSLFYVLIFLSVLNVSISYFFPEAFLLQKIVLTISLLIFIIVLQFFRSPNRVIEINDKQIIAPADGKVVVIEEVVESEYFNGKRRQISIFMSPFNVHSNRNPVSGVVKFFKYHPGKFLVAWHPKSSTENERTTTVIETKNNQQILMRQIAGALARRIVWYIGENSEVTQGEEFGFIKFGSRVDLFIPLDAKVHVSLDQMTVGGKTVIAEFYS